MTNSLMPDSLYKFLQPRIHQSDNLYVLQTTWAPEFIEFTLEFAILNLIGKYYQQQYPDKTIYVASSNWWRAGQLDTYINSVNPDIVVYCPLADPIPDSHANLLKNLQDSGNCEVKMAGCIINGLPVDFWVIACYLFFKQYSEQNLEPIEYKADDGKHYCFKYLFLNYNGKIKTFRSRLVEELKKAGLTNYGHVTLADKKSFGASRLFQIINNHPKYTVDLYPPDAFLHTSVYSTPAVLNQPRGLQLGDMEIWNGSFINLVTETKIEYADNEVFVTEKTIKPIIGMRPFLIYGGKEIYTWLRSRGFDCFDDLFPVDQLMATTDKDEILMLVVNSLKQFVGKDLDKLYQELKPRLLANRQRFFKYAEEHINWLNNLSEKNTVDIDFLQLQLLKKNLHFQKFYSKIKLPTWPDNIPSFDQLPENLQQELIEIHNFRDN